MPGGAIDDVAARIGAALLRRRPRPPLPAQAQTYPNAPIRIISGFPAGTTADISARVVGAKIGQILGGQVVVENRPGAASSIAAASVARADKDGYTLYIGSAANLINAAQNPNLTFDFIKDFTPITLLTSTPTVLVVTPELGVEERQGADRAGQGKAGRDLVRLVGRGELDASRARAVQVAGQA